MLGTVIASSAVVLYVALAVVLYRVCLYRVTTRKLNAALASVMYCVALGVAPWILTWVAFRVGWHFYSNYPNLRESSWDVALAFTTYAGMLLSYALGVIGAAFACWRFLCSNG